MRLYSIANLIFKITGPEIALCTHRMRDYVTSGHCDYDVHIEFDTPQSITLPEGKVMGKVHRWRWIQTEDGRYAAFQQHPDTGEALSLIEADSGWKNVKLRLVDFENDLGIVLDRRTFFAIGDIFICSVLRRGGLVLHSSGISYDGRAVLFSAPSGTGKSTHTSLWKEYYNDTIIINDDMPAIVFQGEVPFAYGTPWSGKTEINCNKGAPLKAIVFLERGDACSITEIKGPQALSRLMSELRKSMYPEMMEICLQSVDKLLKAVPIYLLTCNVSREAVEVVKNTIFK